MLKEFKEFAIKGSAFDLAVGVIIGAAFTGIVNSLVKDIIMPPIGALTGGLDFSNKFIVLKAGKDGADSFTNIADAVKAGAVTWNYGNFITLVINFVIVAFALGAQPVERGEGEVGVEGGALPEETGLGIRRVRGDDGRRRLPAVRAVRLDPAAGQPRVAVRRAVPHRGDQPVLEPSTVVYCLCRGRRPASGYRDCSVPDYPGQYSRY